MKKIVIKFILVLIAIVACLFIAVVTFLKEPYKSTWFERKTNSLELIQVEYIQDACGEHSPRLYELITNSNSMQKEKPVYLALPNGIKSPEDTKYSVNGNKFILKGFRYVRKTKYIMYSKVIESEARRIDVVSWELLGAYKTFDVNEVTACGIQDSVISFSFKGKDFSPNKFIPRQYFDCF